MLTRSVQCQMDVGMDGQAFASAAAVTDKL